MYMICKSKWAIQLQMHVFGGFVRLATTRVLFTLASLHPFLLLLQPSFSFWKHCVQGKGPLHFTVKLSVSRIIFVSVLSKITYHWATTCSSPYFLFCDFWLTSEVLASCTQILKTACYLLPDFTKNRICQVFVCVCVYILILLVGWCIIQKEKGKVANFCHHLQPDFVHVSRQHYQLYALYRT